MDRTAIATSAAPAAVGPYSQAIAAGELLFCSGQIHLDPATGALVEGDIATQTARVLDNLGAVLAAAGRSMTDVVKTTVFLVDIADFAAMNAVYARYMPDPPPARSTIGVAALPKGARVEIELIALRPG
ncbi:MAG TPA: RidA family protein [Candidatus Limnocylindrales bacterium]|nr:RidA family protein [Candidatus Limnocylindrales bacterium]